MYKREVQCLLMAETEDHQIFEPPSPVSMLQALSCQDFRPKNKQIIAKLSCYLVIG